MTDLAAATGVPMTFGLVATRGAGYLVDFLDEAAARGARMIAQTHCRGISVLLSLKTRLPFDLLPAWADLRARPVDEQLAVLADPSGGSPTSRPRCTPTTPPTPAWGRRPVPRTSKASGSTSTACRPTRRWPTSPGSGASTRPRR